MIQMEYNPQPSRQFKQDRIQTLLETCDEPHINRDVQVEGGFIQIADDGSPMRQVFLAITKAEFIIVKQETFVDPGNGCQGDDVSDLSFDEIHPLPILHFFIIDHRAKRFSACTSFGKLYHFEMCLLDFTSDQHWTKWRRILDNFSGSEKGDFAANRVKTSYVVRIDENYHKHFASLRRKFGVPCKKPLQFIHHPLAFKRIESVGTQTGASLDFSPEKKIDVESVVNKQNNQAFLKRNISTSITTFMSDPRVADYKAGSKDSFFPQNTYEPSNRPVDIGHLLRGRLTYLYTGNEIWRKNVNVGNGQLKKSNSDEFISMVTRIEVDKMSPTSSDLSSAKQLQRFRERFGKEKNRKYGDSASTVSLVGDVDSYSESEDEDIDTFFDKVKQKAQKDNGRNGRFLWSLAKCLLLKKDVVLQTNIADVMKEAKFRKLINSQVPLPASLIDFDPLDVSQHLTYMSRKLFFLVSPEDVEMVMLSNGHRIANSIKDVLEFNDVIVRTVITETLQNPDGKAGQIRSLKFFIQVSINLYLCHHDFQSLTAILKGLTSLPLYHMHSLWAALFQQEPFTFCHFMTMVKLLSPDKQYRGYATRVKTCMTRGDSFIPWMDHILQHCFTRKSDEHIEIPIVQAFKDVSHLTGFFDKKSKSSTNPSITKVHTLKNTGMSNIAKSIFTLAKMKNWNLKAKRGKKKTQRKVRFEENCGGETSSTNNEEMKHLAKATWVKRTKSIDDTEKLEADEDTVVHEKDIPDADAAVPVVKYSDIKAHIVITDSVSEASETEEADSEPNEDNGIGSTTKEEGNAVDVENEDVIDSSAASNSSIKVPRMKFSMMSRRKRRTKAKKVKLPSNEYTPAKEINIVVEACAEEEKADAGKDTKDENDTGKVNERQQPVNNSETERRMSYVPVAVTSKRRKSLFEEAAEKHASQEEINEAFEALKASRRSETDARKSALDLITVDDEFAYNAGISNTKNKQKSSVRNGRNRKGKNLNANAGCGVESFYIPSRYVDLRTIKDSSVPQSTKQKSWKDDKKYQDSTNINQNSSDIKSKHSLIQSASQDRLGFLHCGSLINNCCFCANKKCIYGERVSAQVANCQASLLNMETYSRCRVKEYFKLVMEVYDCRSNVDVLQLSFQSN